MPTLTHPMRQRILELIYRMVELDNDQSVSLRTGVLSWLQCQKTHEDLNAGLIDKLIGGVHNRCASVELEQWTVGGKLSKWPEQKIC